MRARHAIDGNRIVGALAVAGAAVACLLTLPGTMAAFGIAFAGLAVAASLVDIAEYRLPDGITAALGALGLAALAMGGDIEAVGWRAVQMLAAGLVLWLLRAGFRALRGRQGLGLGDVKLIAAGAAWTTAEGVSWAVLLACLAALLTALVHGMRRRGERVAGGLVIPFGAFLAPAFWLVWFAQQGGLLP